MSGDSPTADRVVVRPASRLAGRVRVPGDKSISHRAALLGALSHGPTPVTNFLPSADCLSTLGCLERLGVQIERHAEDRITVHGRGPEALAEPDDLLDCGNSGTTMRLLSGVLAARPLFAVLTGDASLRRRPMGRVIEPLNGLGARLTGRQSGRYAPLVSLGPASGQKLRGGEIALKVASAQVKSALLLAGLDAEGPVTVIEPQASRDHTERMLRARGASLVVDPWSPPGGGQPPGEQPPDGQPPDGQPPSGGGKAQAGGNARRIRLSPGARLWAQPVEVPGDPSSAAFLAAAAVMVDQVDLTVEGVGVNPGRIGFYRLLEKMGQPFRTSPEQLIGGEPVADLVLGPPTRLRAIEVGPEEVPGAIDELVLIAVVATRAEGTTVVRGAEELRVKESDRIETIVAGLRAMGAAIEARPDGFVVQGPTPLSGARVESHGDHRIAMALAVASLGARGETVIDGAGAVNVSFPGFFQLLERIAAPPRS